VDSSQVKLFFLNLISDDERYNIGGLLIN
jgi:hypothetical protein